MARVTYLHATHLIRATIAPQMLLFIEGAPRCSLSRYVFSQYNYVNGRRLY